MQSRGAGFGQIPAISLTGGEVQVGGKGEGFKTHLLVVSVGARVDGRRQHRGSRNSGEVELHSGDSPAS